MKNSLATAITTAVFAAACAVGTTIEAGAANTQATPMTQRARSRGCGVKRQRRLRRVMRRITQRLELSDVQRTEIESIIETERANIEPLMHQLGQTRVKLRATPRRGRYAETSEARTFAAQQAQIKRELFLAKERVRKKVYAVLTPEQRAKAKQMREDLEARIQQPFAG